MLSGFSATERLQKQQCSAAMLSGFSTTKQPQKQRATAAEQSELPTERLQQELATTEKQIQELSAAVQLGSGNCSRSEQAKSGSSATGKQRRPESDLSSCDQWKRSADAQRRGPESGQLLRVSEVGRQTTAPLSTKNKVQRRHETVYVIGRQHRQLWKTTERGCRRRALVTLSLIHI